MRGSNAASRVHSADAGRFTVRGGWRVMAWLSAGWWCDGVAISRFRCVCAGVFVRCGLVADVSAALGLIFRNMENYSMDKKYIEHFFMVTFQGEAFTFDRVQEIDNPVCAEVNVPYHTDTEIHNYTCYI